MKSNLKVELDERRFERKVEKFLNSTLAIILSVVFVLIGIIAWYNVVFLAN